MRQITLHWTQVQPAVRSFVYTVLRHPQAVEDVVQEIALTIVDKFDTFEPGTNFNAWTFAIARNKLMNWQTVHRRDRHIFDDTAIRNLAAAHQRIAPELEERRDALRRCLTTLDRRSRDLVRLRYEDHCSVTELARRHRLTPNAASILLHRIRRSLLECIRRKLRDAEEGVQS